MSQKPTCKCGNCKKCKSRKISQRFRARLYEARRRPAPFISTRTDAILDKESMLWLEQLAKC